MRLLGVLWVLPVALPIWLVYLLPCWALGWLRFDGWARRGVVRFRVVAARGWYARLWRSWAGFAAPYAILLRTTDPETERHELRHTDQWLLFGPLFPLAYLGALAAVGYHANPFEADARRWAEVSAAAGGSSN
jgi:hypothetical protein